MSGPFCQGGGCTAKLGAGILGRVLSKIPRGAEDPDLLVGYDSRDDAAVYRLSEALALVQTLDFFPPMLDDPYRFGQIAAANALSDIYAMGGEPKIALNIVCFPERMDLNVLGQIVRGGGEKVLEAGAVLAGGHSIADSGVKYGLSVTGVVDPRRLLRNDTPEAGDALLLTKRLGVGLLCTADRVGEASKAAVEEAIQSMTTLNKFAAGCCARYPVHACTDVTGFGLLGHLHEMLGATHSAVLHAERLPVFPEALRCADEFLLTAAAQRNRNYLGERVRFEGVPFAVEEVLFDPQTSGGLLIALPQAEAPALLGELRAGGAPAEIIGTVVEPMDCEIQVLWEE